jgi:TolB-like protein/Tfp pilus assembly protein PilF
MPAENSDQLKLSKGSRLGPYEIASSIGAGAMGEVFRARDTRLNRDVAVKVLPTDFATDAERLRRFEQESKTLAALNHPNVLTIHDAGVHEGMPYLVSELLEGRTLREEMRGAVLPMRKAVEYALQIAHGLAAANGKGVIHRDLKPDNIFVTKDGRVKILDFGLAKLIGPAPIGGGRGGKEGGTLSLNADADAIANATEAGRVLGTPAYMSPEQVRGEPADHRADIFGFGCVLYEMLSGMRAFRRDTPVESMHAVLNDTPPELSTTNPNLQPGLARIVERCLEKQPDDRFQSAHDLAFAIEVARDTGGPAPGGNQRGAGMGSRRWGVVFGIGVLALVAVGAGLWFVHQTGETPKGGESLPGTTNAPAAPSVAPAADEKSIAVLPFVSMSANKADEYLSDGMTEELLNRLARVPGLRVPGRSSSFAFKGKTEDDIFRKVGEQLNVTAVLEGSVRKAGDKLRITAQLINVADGFHLWSQTYDREMGDILAVQTEVAEQVVEALQVKLGVEAARALAKTPTENPEAHRLYLLGRYHFGKATQAGWSDAIQAFNQAIQLDPTYALAYCGLADNYNFLGGSFMPGKEAWAKEKDAAQKAVALDPNLADAHLSLALALAGDFDWSGMEREMKRALELNPNLALARDQYAWLLTLLGRFDEADAQSKIAVELDPLSPLLEVNRGYWLYLARRFDEANMHFRKALELDANYPWAHRTLGWSLLWQGDKAGALAMMETAQSLDADPWSIGSFGYALAVSGDRAKAEQILRDLESLAEQRYVTPSASTLVYIGLGEKEKALDGLDKVYEDRDPQCWFMKAEPIYDSLRTEPRFQALVKQGFPDP